MLQQLRGIVFITLFFGFMYMLLDYVSPGSFGFQSLIDPYYFSSTTMSTAGYGDFSPKTNVAKVLVMLQQLFIMGEVLSILDIKPGKPARGFKWIKSYFSS